MKKKLISLLLFFVLAFSSVMMVSAEEYLERPQEWAEALGLTEMNGADAIKKIGTENSVFLDLRAKEDYAAGHIKNTVSAPVCNADYSVPVSNREAFVAQMKELKVAENDTTIYLSCYAGTFCVDFAADWLINYCDVEANNLVRVTGGTFGDADLAAASVSVHAEYVFEQVEAGNGLVLDVRANDTFNAGYLDGSLHAPLFDANGVSNAEDDALATAFKGFVEANKDLLTNNKVYILCNSGARGAEAAHKLFKAVGISGKVFTIEGGAKYITANYPEKFVTYQSVTGAETVAAANAADDNKVVIDLRTAEKYAAGHIKGVPSYPVFDANGVTTGYDNLAKEFLAKVAANADYFKGNDIYLICNSGARGAQAATKLLMQAGYSNSNIFTVTGGAKGTDDDMSVPNNLRWVSGKQAVSVIDNADYVIIDVRAAEKYAAGHLKGSLSLPLFGEGNAPTTLEDDMANTFLAYLNDNKEALSGKTIYILCNSGARGVTNAFALAEKAGFTTNVLGIEGGAKDADIIANLDYVTADQALSVLGNDAYVIVDVRAAEKYAEGHIKGSISLPLFGEGNAPTTLEDDMAEYFLAYVKDNKDYFADKTVYILCNSGARGVVNALALSEKAGLTNVLGIEGGAKNESLQAIFVTDTPAVGTPALKYTKLTHNGKVKLPTLTVTDAEGNALVEGEDYVYVIYNAKGTKVTKPAKVSTYTVKVTYRGEYIGNEQATLTYRIVPAAVTELKAKLTAHDDVKLNWTKAEGATGYYVYYKKSSADSYSTKNRVSVTGTTKTFKDLSDGVKYTFKVVPYFGEDKVTSVKYTTVTKTTLKKVAGVKVSRNSKKVKVSWTNISGESGYQISRSTKKDGTANIKTYSGSDLKTKTITLSKASKYYYKVRAYKVEDGKKVYGPWSSVVYK